MNTSLSLGAAGMRTNLDAFDRAAGELAAATTGPLPGGPLLGGGELGAGTGLQPSAEDAAAPAPDVASALTGAMLAQRGFQANIQTVRTASEVYRDVIDLI